MIGLDGCKVGWIAAIISPENNLSFAVFPNISQLWSQWGEATRILIDMPIGLTDCKKVPRECDRLARKALGRPRSSSVFPPPCRNALYAKTYDQANLLNRKHTHLGLSIQTWNICSKILEIDLFLRRNLRMNQVLWESHPEVCFWGLNGQSSMKFNKRKPAGYQERLQILEEVSQQLHLQIDFDKEINRFPRSQVKKDDLLDAWVLALTATGRIGSFQTFPANPTFDVMHIPQRIVYVIHPPLQEKVGL